MSMRTAPRPFPLAPLLFAGAAIVLTVAAAAAGRLTGATEIPTGAHVVVAHDIRFADRPDGGIDVFSDGGATPFTEVLPTTDNFLRATMRGLARERVREQGTPATPFRLTQWDDGRLTLDDPITHRHVELESFGETNEAVFVNLLAQANTANAANTQVQQGAKP